MRYFLCSCSCGNEVEVTLGNLRSGHTTSCGCFKLTGQDNHNYKHGFTQKHKTYKAWCKIKERCYNPNSIDYPNYGAVGISMSETFKNDFISFYKELGEAPSKEYSVDRIDYTKGYVEGNLRWATDSQQARNKGKMKNNSSGCTGVHWEDKIHPDGSNSTTYAVAQWKEYNEEGKQLNRKKSFSAKKLGLLPAFASAVEYREQMICKLNSLGYGYSDNHGKY